MKEIKIKCPAKINLDLKVDKKDINSGFHPIKSIMQTISLYDYLYIKVTEGNSINLNGTSNEISYDENNICYKAAKLFLEKTEKQYLINIFIEKNIPVAAGLAGGSTDGAGVLYGLNKIFDDILSEDELNQLAASLGSDLNFCLAGGTKLCTGRGENIENMPFDDFELSLIKPKNLKISAKEAYEAYDNLKETSNMPNDLEYALLKSKKYPQLKYLTSKGFQMSGSGPVYFIKNKNIKLENKNYEIYNNLKTVNHGVIECERT